MSMEVLQNPDFELGGASWQNSDSAGRGLDSIRVHGGVYAQRLLASALTDYAVYQDLPVDSAGSYDAAGWVTTDSLAGPGASLALLWLDTLGLADSIPPAHLLATDLLGTVTGTRDWTLLSATVNAPAGAVGVRFQLRVAAEPGDTGGTVFDDLSLALRPPPPPPDINPPVIALTAPNDGAVVSHIVSITADATDDRGVAGVRFTVDGTPIGTEIPAPPFGLGYNTDTLANGPHLLSAVARDSAGNTAIAAVVHLTVTNPRPADIVMILSDDQRFDQMQYMPLTSALLNAETVRFNWGFVTTSLCCPSRSSLLTGLYAHNHGVLGNSAPNGGATRFDPSSTIATWLQAAGYRTGLIGKYLNQYDLIAPAIPPGWNDFEAIVGSATGTYYYDYTLNDNGTILSFGSSVADYGTEVLTNRAVRFINTMTRNQPMFLYFAPFAPHAPATPYPTDAGRYNTFPNWRPSSFNEADVSDKPAWIKALPKITTSQTTASDALHRRQLESLQAMDRGIASIVAALQQADRWNNTLVIFMSDNGLTWGEHRLRDRKFCPYEECIRVPFWVRKPGVTARTDTNLVANIDLAPTMAAWAGITPPGKVNGVNLLPLLQNPATPWRTALLIEHLGTGSTLTDASGVRTSRYLYNEYQNGNKELYDLKTDPLQLTSVASKATNAALVASLRATLNALKLQ